MNKRKKMYQALCQMFDSVHNRCMALIVLMLIGIHILSWHSKIFTNWYRMQVFPIWTGVLGRLSNLFRGSVGEILIGMGVCLVLFEVLLLPIFVWQMLKNCRRKKLLPKSEEQLSGKQKCKRQKRGIQRFWKWNLRFLCWVLIYIYGTETLNCYILYHASTVEEQYYSQGTSYGMQELIEAYTEVVTCANDLSRQVTRNENGEAVYYGTDTELYEECKKAMKRQGVVYPYLSGYYPNPKPIRASHFMSQQYLLGIYFPFTMEANYNTVMYPVNLPTTICHEFSHVKGIILEDEANYFGFIACIESEDPYLQYSGYLSVLGYLTRQVRKSVPEETRRELVCANEQVLADDVFLTEEQWEQVEKKAVVSTDAVNKATNVFLEKNLTMNGVAEGIQSYSQVVRLVIQYYSSKKSSTGI